MNSTAFDTALQLVRTLSEQLEAYRDTSVGMPVPEREHADDASGWICDECDAIVRARDFMFDVINAHTIPRLSELKSRHNNTTLIYRLPLDVLASIFKFVVDSDACELPSARPPLQLASVSRWWREVALGTPVLWTWIGTEAGSSDDLISIFLDRSKAAVLDVELAIDDEDSDFVTFPPREIVRKSRHRECVPRILKALVPHTSRLRSFSFKNVPDFHKEFFTSPAPQLVALCYAVHSGTECYAPTNIFAGHTPRLRDLQLISTHVALTSPIYTGLTKLHLGHILYRSCMIHDLIRVIKACPLLEELALSYIHFYTGDSEGGGFHMLSLPSVHEPIALVMLRRMEVRSLAREDAGEVFMSVVMPPSSLLVLPLYSHEDFNDVVLKARDNLKNLARIRSLRLTSPVRECHYSRASCELWGETASKRGLTLLHVPFDVRHATGVASPLFRSISQFFSIQIETLSLTGIPGDWSPDIPYAALFSSLPSLIKFSLESCALACSFLKVLIATPTSHLCPWLAKLYLANMSGLDTSLVEIAKSRGCLDGSRVGRLRKLALAECPLADECMELLKAYVQVKSTHKSFDLSPVRADIEFINPPHIIRIRSPEWNLPDDADA
ncbi:hypothetical protein BOTBODRAFT_169967 [Botryobasidium botryosum FD-172 SS1]|uniref:Uncharacterized protein n=1 Tax=Botryobasidium botryosum (strain FD-172 SS1) TaxID=930990 RepID=A0A067N841_BOTB1|nr:hypothetical protein BOTBODRAFT_169967 [Botryobasidium botryosum FD-172 SS1]